MSMVEKPRRVQLSRRKGWRMPENTVKVDRTNKKFGNPFTIGCNPDRIATISLKQWLALANAIFRPTHSRRVPQQLANQFGPESASTDPALHSERRVPL